MIFFFFSFLQVPSGDGALTVGAPYLTNNDPDPQTVDYLDSSYDAIGSALRWVEREQVKRVHSEPLASCHVA